MYTILTWCVLQNGYIYECQSEYGRNICVKNHTGKTNVLLKKNLLANLINFHMWDL